MDGQNRSHSSTGHITGTWGITGGWQLNHWFCCTEIRNWGCTGRLGQKWTSAMTLSRQSHGNNTVITINGRRVACIMNAWTNSTQRPTCSANNMNELCTLCSYQIFLLRMLQSLEDGEILCIVQLSSLTKKSFIIKSDKLTQTIKRKQTLGECRVLLLISSVSKYSKGPK